MSPNRAFSLFAAAASLAIAIGAAIKGSYPVTAVFGVLAVGFAVRSAERWGPWT
jgi:hypothetical protein